MLTRIRALLSLNDPGWGRGGGGRDDQRPPDRPSGNNDGPPDLDELWRDFNRRLNRLFGKGGGEPPRGGGNPLGSGPPSMKGAGAGVGLIAGIGLVLWLGSGFYIIQEGQAAAILRFGEFKYMVEQAGFKWRLPYPIESAELVDVQRLRQVEVGYRTNVKDKVPRESLILTGDTAIVDLQFAVQYRISDPRAFLFNNHHYGAPEELVRQAAETATREVIGRTDIDKVLYEEKEQVARDALKLIQANLDRYRSGFGIVDVTIQQAQPPEQVQAAFEDANKAAQDRERLINEGRAYANDVIPKAGGTAARLMQEAEGYRERVIATAEGDADRFSAVLAEYSKAPRVTRDRMYLETMQQVFTNTSKVYIDSRANNNLLYLPLDRLMQQGDAPRPAQPPPPPPMAGEVPVAAQPNRDGLRSRDRDAGR
jgi:modulator of FtsH protease HflK